MPSSAWKNKLSGYDVTQTITFAVVPSGPTISSFSVSSPPVARGSSVTLTVTARGGTGPLTYAYAGLSSGCSSANVSSLTCTPTATGTFTVTVAVTDAVGKSATATVDLIVNPPFVSTVSCGHDLSCSVQSSAALSNVKFAGNTIHFTATGPAGTQGYANVTVPKAAIPNIDEMHVFVKRSQISSTAVTWKCDAVKYFILIPF